MRADISDIIKKADIEKWKTIKVEYGEEFLDIRVPQTCVTLQMRKMPCLAHSKEEISKALNNPMGSATIPEIIRSKGKPAEEPFV